MKVLVAVALLMCCFVASGFGRTILVPSEQPTIQAGVDAAEEGDTVLVAAGIYTGDGNRDIVFFEKSIFIISESGPKLTVIDCQGDSLDPHRGFYFDSYTESEVMGFTIQGGYKELGGAILIDWFSKPTIRNCRFTNNYAIDWGGAVCCLTSAALTITNCTLRGNEASYGGGIDLYQCSPTITNCVIAANTAALGGGISLYQSSPTISNCTIVDNTVGGGVYSNYSFPIFLNCIIWDNEFEIIINFGSPVVTYCDIQDGWTGEGNIDQCPNFMSTHHGFNYILKPASPCVDAGDPTIKDALYDWHPKWPKWYHDGARSDMGAYGGPNNTGWLNK